MGIDRTNAQLFLNNFSCNQSF